MNTELPGGEQPDAGLEDPPADGFVLRMLLGSQLRRLREAAGVTADQAGYEIRASRSKISTDAQDFYAASRRAHVEVAISLARRVSELYPGGLPAAGLRSPDEPLLGLVAETSRPPA